MTNKTLEQRIAELEKASTGQVSLFQNYFCSLAIDIIYELKSKPCEYIYQGKGTSFCKLAASHAKGLEEAWRVIEELRAQLESKNELISNLINGE